MKSEAEFPDWVTAAAQMPVAFAQVREDALLDQWAVGRIGGRDVRVVTIASGGCTAAALAATARVAHLHLVDMSAAQIALTRLKLHLLHTADPRARAQLLGHVALAAGERKERLMEAFDAIGLSPDVLGPIDVVSESGPDHLGRYELVFARLRAELASHSDELIELLRLPDPTARTKRIAETTQLGRALDQAFECVMALPNLVRLFSAEATRNSREPFSRHFARRTRHAMSEPSASANPYLWQMLAGRFPEGVTYPWLDAPAPHRVPDVTVSTARMDQILATGPGSFDYVHLSNILDWLSPEQAHRTLSLACEALRPGGYTLIRQLNSTLDIRLLGDRFEWLARESDELHRRDRSFFYRSLHLGRKR